MTRDEIFVISEDIPHCIADSCSVRQLYIKQTRKQIWKCDSTGKFKDEQRVKGTSKQPVITKPKDEAKDH